MRILFFMRHQGYVKNFESTLDELARRGHDVHLAFDQIVASAAGRPTLKALEDLAHRHPNMTWGAAPDKAVTAREDFGRRTRAAISWMSYLRPEVAAATKARKRLERRAPKRLRRLLAGVRYRPRIVRSALRVARVIEAATPVRAIDRAFLREHAPDLVLVTPLLEGGPQTGYLRAAHSLGLRTGLCVSSWDNLTSKGVIHEMPGIVTLWNETQATEAIRLHGVPRERTVSTGAQPYDHWFDWEPSTERAQFLRRVGLDPSRPVVVYMCSSGFIGGQEADHVEAWVRRLRTCVAPEMRDVGILIRPHPTNARQWEDFDTAGLGQVALWRLEDTEPATQRAKEEFFDTIHHASAVVGLNSTSLIESAIIGRPALTWLAPDYEASQNGTIHFRLIAGEDGMLVVGRTWDEHVGHLCAALRDQDLDGDRRRRFVRAFVRPRGMNVRATDVLVDTLEQAATAPPPAPVKKLGLSFVRVGLTPVVYWPREPFDKARARLRRKSRRKGRRRSRSARQRFEGRARRLVKKVGQLRKRRRRLVKRIKRLKPAPWLILLRLLTRDDSPRGRLLRSNMPRVSELAQPRIVYPVSKNSSEKSAARKKQLSQRGGNA